MSNFLVNLGLLASQNPFLAYFIIYFVTIFLGTISAFASFFIIFRGLLGAWGPPLLFLTIFCSNVTGDLLWYSLGWTLRDTRLGNFIKNRLPGHTRIEAGIQKNGMRWVFASKFLYGSSLPILFFVGWMKMDFKRFFKTAVAAILCWLPIITAIAFGLVAGLTPLHAAATLKEYTIIFLLGIVLFLIGNYILAKIFKFLFRRYWSDMDDPEGKAQPGLSQS